MDKHTATLIATAYGIPLGVNFHALSSFDVASIIRAADAQKYRAPKDANGSRARYFHALLVRYAARKN